MKQTFYCLGATIALSLGFWGVATAQQPGQAQATQKYVVKGTLGDEMNGRKVRLFKYEGHSQDSAIVKGGQFQFSGVLKDPSLAFISIAPAHEKPAVMGGTYEMPDAQTFYLSAGTTVVKGKDLASSVIDNPVEKEYLALQAAQKPLQDQMNVLRSRIYMGKDKDSVRMWKAAAKELNGALFQVDLAFVKKHPASYVSFDVVRNHGIVIEDGAAFEEMFNATAASFRDSEDGKKLAKGIPIAKRLTIGQPAIEFAQNDVNDQPIALSSFKGKYVLVDFWASWCGPCKMEYPYLHKAYDKYKDKNFEILGVSLDSKKDIWVKAIADNHFTWPLVCDLKGFENAAAVMYGVRAIPRNFLIDPQGKIIAKDMRGDDLVEKLDEVIGGGSANGDGSATTSGYGCTIQVDIDTVHAAKVYIAWQEGEKHRIDSAAIKDGKATLHESIPYPVFTMLWLDNRGFGYENGHRPDMLYVYMENATMQVRTTDSVKKAVVSGSPLNDEIAVYRKYVSGPMGVLEDGNAEIMLAPAAKRADTAFCNPIWAREHDAVIRLKELDREFAAANPDNYGSLLALSDAGGANINADVIGPLYNGLSERLRNTEAGKHLADQIETARKTGIGVMAPDFTQNDVNDKPLTLSAFRGKYVLLDFWASWCGPCRAENPNYVKAYHQYKDRNFTLLSVSLDRPGEKSAWLAAIKKDGLEWPQVSDLKYWFNDVAKLYDIRAVPQNLLIDPSGRIVAKNLRGEELLKKLGELIK